MSLAGLCSRDTITIKRLAVTQGTAGGQVRAPTTAARGSLPTSANCRIQPLSFEERREFGIKGSHKAFELFFTSDPSLTIADQVEFTDADGSSVVSRVANPSLNEDSQSRLWSAIVEEFTTQQ